MKNVIEIVAKQGTIEKDYDEIVHIEVMYNGFIVSLQDGKRVFCHSLKHREFPVLGTGL